VETASGADLVARYASLFDEAGIDYMLVGAFAVMVHGMPRFSADLDFAVRVPFDERARVVALLGAHGASRFEERVDPQWGRRVACMTREGIVLETFFVAEGPVTDREFSRCVRRHVGGADVRIVSAEDLVLRKLVNTRIRRGADFDDALGVLVRMWDAFDRSYVREHCGPYRVCDVFERALEEAGREVGRP
jgi:hypothetical protein